MNNKSLECNEVLLKIELMSLIIESFDKLKEICKKKKGVSNDFIEGIEASRMIVQGTKDSALFLYKVLMKEEGSE